MIYHQRFVSRASLGPELYFHLRCLDFREKMSRGVVTKPHAECLYAMLTAWGMNSRAARLEPFHIFHQSLQSSKLLIHQLSGVDIQSATQSDWNNLQSLWNTLFVTNSQSNYQLVGRSKVLAHLMPDWIAPIDRAHTLKFLYNSTSIPKKASDQCDFLKEIHEDFIKPVSARIHTRISTWVQSASACGWDSSVPKTIDNLIWGVH